MSNLGKYQDLVVSAKAAGGVDSLIRKIGDGAVAKAAPRLVLKGVLGSLAAVAVIGAAASAVRSRLRGRIASAAEAEAQLRAAVGEPREDNNGGDQQ